MANGDNDAQFASWANQLDVGQPGYLQLEKMFGGPRYTPEAQFSQFGARIAPALGQRMAGLQSPLTARWMLQAPTAMAQGGTGSFTDYLTGMASGPSETTIGYTPMDYETMRNRAQIAANVADWSSTQLTSAFEDAALTEDELMQRAYYQQQFGAGADAGRNQRALAQALWQSRYQPTPAGGGLGGTSVDPTLSRAIGNTIASLYNARLGQGKSGAGFLNWFLKRPVAGAAAVGT